MAFGVAYSQSPVGFVYDSTAMLIKPASVGLPLVTPAGHAQFEFVSLLAMAAYAVAAYVVVTLLRALRSLWSPDF